MNMFFFYLHAVGPQLSTKKSSTNVHAGEESAVREEQNVPIKSCQKKLIIKSGRESRLPENNTTEWEEEEEEPINFSWHPKMRGILHKTVA